LSYSKISKNRSRSYSIGPVDGFMAYRNGRAVIEFVIGKREGQEK